MLFRKKRNNDIQYKTIACSKLTDDEILQCKQLFDNHYGVWGEGSNREGNKLKFEFNSLSCGSPKVYADGYSHDGLFFVLLYAPKRPQLGRGWFLYRAAAFRLYGARKQS